MKTNDRPKEALEEDMRGIVKELVHGITSTGKVFYYLQERDFWSVGIARSSFGGVNRTISPIPADRSSSSSFRP